jgi:hypothetical protein
VFAQFLFDLCWQRRSAMDLHYSACWCGLALLGGYCYFLSLFSIGTHLGINKLFWVLPTLGGLLIVNAPSAWLSSDLYEATFGFFYSENKIEYPSTVFMLTIFIVGSLFFKKPKVIS